MPVGAWLAIPWVTFGRLVRRGNRVPWMVPGAVRFLNRHITARSVILELGSGRSTAWYAARASRVVSLESSDSWYAEVAEQLHRLRLDNCDLRLVSLSDFPAVIREQSDASIDVAVIDCQENAKVNRITCVEAVTDKLKPGGLLVLDDADRERYCSAPLLLPRWHRFTFIGLKSVPLVANQTDIYVRPCSGALNECI